MGNTAGELAHTLHLLGLQKLSLKPLVVCEIDKHGQDERLLRDSDNPSKHEGVENGAVLSPEIHFKSVNHPRVPEFLNKSAPVLGGIEPARSGRSPQNLLPCPPCQFTQFIVDLDETSSLGLAEGDRLGREFKKGPEFGLALGECLLDPLAFGDIHDDPPHAHGLRPG